MHQFPAWLIEDRIAIIELIMSIPSCHVAVSFLFFFSFFKSTEIITVGLLDGMIMHVHQLLNNFPQGPILLILRVSRGNLVIPSFGGVVIVGGFLSIRQDHRFLARALPDSPAAGFPDFTPSNSGILAISEF